MNSDQALIACAVDEASSKGTLHNNGTYIMVGLIHCIWSLLTEIKIHLCCPCFKFCNWVFVLFASAVVLIKVRLSASRATLTKLTNHRAEREQYSPTFSL